MAQPGTADPRDNRRVHPGRAAGDADLPGVLRLRPGSGRDREGGLHSVFCRPGRWVLIGVIIAYVNHSDAPDWVKTHYRFQIRTFWIGLLYGLISLVTAIILIGILFGLFTFVWWIVRSAKGLQRLSRGEPYENAATWLW
jgi:uncharacterized membrane protein